MGAGTAKDVIMKLKEAISKNENVLLAYLFGSRAKGISSPISDYDVAVLLRNNDLRSLGEVLFAVSKALRAREDFVDILDLKIAPIYRLSRD